MSNTEVYESLITEVCGLDRTAMIDRLSHFPGNLRLDFTPEFLDRCDDERLRHLLLAAEWRARCKFLQGQAAESAATNRPLADFTI